MNLFINDIMRSSKFISASSDSFIRWDWSTTDRKNEIHFKTLKDTGTTSVFIAYSNDGEQVDDTWTTYESSFLMALTKAYSEMKSGEFGKEISNKLNEVIHNIENFK